MKKIDWKARIKNKAFWVAMIPTVLLLVKSILHAVGIELDIIPIQENIMAIIEPLFVLLAMLGIAVDTSTPGITDKEK